MAITVSIQSRNGKELVKGGLQLPEEVKSISTSDALGNLKQNAGTDIYFYYIAAHSIVLAAGNSERHLHKILLD